MKFERARYVVFVLALASYVLSFFHRTAPAAIAGELAQAFSIGSAVLGTLAATYFYVYTLLQVPVGVLADTLGPRRLLTYGGFVAAAGSFLFALAPTWEVAAIGRTLVGVGVSVAFISVLKVSAVWFPPERFATLAGVAMFAGNLGAVTAGAPLAWMVTQVSWRSVFVALGVLSAALAVATWWFLRDRPPAASSAAPAAESAADTPEGTRATPAPARVRWTSALGGVLSNPSTWPAFVVNAAIAGTYLAFAGLWAVPYLQQVHGLSRVDAANHVSLLGLGLAFGAIAVGMISDRLRSRSGVMRVFALLYVLSWAPWVAGVSWPQWATLLACLVMGFVMPGFTLSWTIAKEANPPEHSGIATSVVNVGIFLGTGVLQPLAGWVLDRGRAAGDMAGAWDSAIGLLAATAAFGAVMTLFVRERPVQRLATAQSR